MEKIWRPNIQKFLTWEAAGDSSYPPPIRRMKIDHFQKIIFKIPAMGANDRQFDPELRTVFLFSANSLDFSALRF